MSRQIKFDMPKTGIESPIPIKPQSVPIRLVPLRNRIDFGVVATMIGVAALILGIAALVINVPKHKVIEPKQDHHPSSNADDHPHPDNRTLADTSTTSVNLYHPADNMVAITSVVSTEHIGKVSTPSTVILDVYVHGVDGVNETHLAAFGDTTHTGGMMHVYGTSDTTGSYLCKLPQIEGAHIIGGFFQLTRYKRQDTARNQAIVLSTDDSIVVGTNGSAPLETLATLALTNADVQNPDHADSTSAITSSYSLETQKYLYIHDTGGGNAGGQNIDFHIQLKITFTLK